MNIIDEIWVKYQQWQANGETRKPNSIILPPKAHWEFQRYLGELDANHSMPISFLNNMNIYMSPGATEIKIGVML